MRRIRIAIQSKGRLMEASLQFLNSCGFSFSQNGRTYVASCENTDLDVLFLRDDDIPEYVERGIADFGIVGENILLEGERKVAVVRKLNFSRCSLVIALPQDSHIQKLDDLEGERIATSYPNMLRKFLKEKGVNAAIIPLTGSVEIAPALNLADAICDLTQTGRTLRENFLKPLVTIFDSQAVLIRTPTPKDSRVKSFEQLFTSL